MVEKDAQLIDFVKYEGDTDLREFLIYTPMKTTTRAIIFDVMKNFQHEENRIWEKFFNLCYNGAPAMLGIEQGSVARTK